MPRLIQHYLDASRKIHHHRHAPAHILGLTWDSDAFRAEIPDRRCDVVAHQRQLVAAAGLMSRSFCRVHAYFGWRQRKDQPSLTRVDMPKAKHVAGVARNASGSVV
jgi:hypothetical protein